MEFWKDIKGYKNVYQISNFGNVKYLMHFDLMGRKKEEKILSKFIDSSNGYYCVWLGKQLTAYGFKWKYINE